MAFHAQGPTTVKAGFTEILKFPVGDQAMASIVLDASTVSEVSGVRKLVAGTLLAKNANSQYQQYSGPSSVPVAGVLAYDVEFFDSTGNSDTPAAMFFHEAVFRADRIVQYNTYGAEAKHWLFTCRFD